jgi:membrane-bound lytic murein transglycosylase D
MRTALSSILVLLMSCWMVLGQEEETYSLEDLADVAEEWANENVDEDILATLRQIDREKTTRFFEDLERVLQGESISELAGIRDMARTVLPLLETYEETAPYAVWLKTRMDYLDVANDLTNAAPAPKVEPEKKPPNPPAKQGREIWITKVSKRPLLENANPFVPKLKPIFRKQGVPPELVWVAEVESSFDPRARSPVGAAGLFQLMPATAKRFGLSRFPSTSATTRAQRQAAAQYLRFLQRKFKDWRPALAAYNAGEGTVERLLRKHNGRTFDDIAPHLPSETQMYVPKIEATVLRREGRRLNELKAG